MTTILENANGVRITDDDKMQGHYVAVLRDEVQPCPDE